MKDAKQKRSGRKLRLRLRTIADLSHHLAVPADYLCNLAAVLDESTERCPLYRSWLQRKKPSGTRPIDTPREQLKWVQKRINARILQRLRVDQTAIGGVRGMSLLNNVRPHVGKPMVAKFDLENFFLNITSGQVYDLFCSMGCSPDVARLLTRLTTFKGRIPQGAPTSSMIAVLVAGYGGDRSFNSRLRKLALTHGSDCSMWLDDITLSGPSYLPRLESAVGQIARQSGFALNQSKNAFLASNEQQVVTGLVVNEKPNVPKADRRKLRAILHKYRMLGPEGLAEKSGPGLKAHLRGKIAHVQQVNPGQGEKLLALFNSIEWPQ